MEVFFVVLSKGAGSGYKRLVFFGWRLTEDRTQEGLDHVLKYGEEGYQPWEGDEDYLVEVSRCSGVHVGVCIPCSEAKDKDQKQDKKDWFGFYMLHGFPLNNCRIHIINYFAP